MKFIHRQKLTERTLRRFKYSVCVFGLLAASHFLISKYLVPDQASDTYTSEMQAEFPVSLRDLQEQPVPPTPEDEDTTTEVTEPEEENSENAPEETSEEESAVFTFNGKDYSGHIITNHSQGYVEEYFDGDRCDSYLLLPGMNLLNKNFMAVMYFIFLLYLFLGISIIADIFMEAIEVICSKTKSIEVSDKEGKRYTYDVPIWNATIANLTLMALGSSAPEILLSVIDTLNTLGSTPGELGVFSIVGSAAFNLLAISGVCIVCVEGDEPKKIYDLGVFGVTSLFSIFAYIWMYIVLSD